MSHDFSSWSWYFAYTIVLLRRTYDEGRTDDLDQLTTTDR